MISINRNRSGNFCVKVENMNLFHSGIFAYMVLSSREMYYVEFSFNLSTFEKIF